MVQVLLKKQVSNYQKLIVSGHANFKAIGKDIVCAGISAIIFGFMNALNKEFKSDVNINIDNKTNEIIIDVNNSSSELNIVFKTIYWQLLTIQEQYQNYLEIIELEE